MHMPNDTGKEHTDPDTKRHKVSLLQSDTGSHSNTGTYIGHTWCPDVPLGLGYTDQQSGGSPSRAHWYDTHTPRPLPRCSLTALMQIHTNTNTLVFGSDRGHTQI